MTPRRLTAALVATAALAAPASAHAATATAANGVLTYTAAPGEANDVTFSFLYGSYYVQDSGAPIQASAPCVASDAHTVHCPYSSVTSVSADLGDGDDTLQTLLALTPITAHGGAGDDKLYGGLANDTLYGDAGLDTVSGNSGNDVIDGGAGSDTLHGDGGDDTIAAVDGESDTIACGDGSDALAADASDAVATDCETVSSSVSLPPIGTPNPGIDPPGSLAGFAPNVVEQSPFATAAGVVPIELACPSLSVSGCTGAVTLSLVPARPARQKIAAARRRKMVTVGHKRFRLAAGTTRSVPVRLSRRGVRLLRSRHKLLVNASASIQAEGGKLVTASRQVVIRERRTAARRVTRKKKR